MGSSCAPVAERPWPRAIAASTSDLGTLAAPDVSSRRYVKHIKAWADVYVPFVAAATALANCELNLRSSPYTAPRGGKLDTGVKSSGAHLARCFAS